MKRREFLRYGGSIGVGVMASGVVHGQRTPPQTEGPFFPEQRVLDTDADLTKREGTTECADGEQVLIQVFIVDEQDKPISNARVYIWQACASGRYKHSEDTNKAKLDKNFQYSAQLKTNEKGMVNIKTIIPGAYPASSTRTRPAHIHFRFEAQDHSTLITQMYFKGDKYIAIDRILHETEVLYGKQAKQQLIVDFDQQKTEQGLRKGLFRIVLGQMPSVK